MCDVLKASLSHKSNEQMLKKKHPRLKNEHAGAHPSRSQLFASGRRTLTFINFRYIHKMHSLPSSLSWQTIAFSCPLLQKCSLSGEPFPNKNDLTDPDEQEHHSFDHRALYHAPMIVGCGCGDDRSMSAKRPKKLISFVTRQNGSAFVA